MPGFGLMPRHCTLPPDRSGTPSRLPLTTLAAACSSGTVGTGGTSISKKKRHGMSGRIALRLCLFLCPQLFTE